MIGAVGLELARINRQGAYGIVARGKRKHGGGPVTDLVGFQKLVEVQHRIRVAHWSPVDDQPPCYTMPGGETAATNLVGALPKGMCHNRRIIVLPEVQRASSKRDHSLN